MEQEKDVKVLLLGLDGSGKTSILHKIILGETFTIPTFGFTVQTISYKKLSFTIWDLGGQNNVRSLWRHYYENKDVVIFVIDSNDKDRLEEARKELHSVLYDDDLRNVSVLIFANKQDLSNSINATEITKVLKLDELKQKWFIQPCCASTGEGLFEGFNWLSTKF